MLDPELIKAHLRLDDDEFTDQLPLLNAYARAAWRKVETHTGRALIEVTPALEGEPPGDLAVLLPEDAPENALALDDDLRLAMLLLVAHWYRNREAVSESGTQQQHALPLAFDSLVGPHRWVNL